MHSQRKRKYGDHSITKRSPNGEGFFTRRGYKIISENGHQIFEHRSVMQKVLGRKLRRNEDVHHKNEHTSDNRPENLEVMTKSQHAKLHNPRGKPCPVNGCQRQHFAKGLCEMHYQRWQKHGDPTFLCHPAKIPKGTLCSIKGCLNPYYSKNLCHHHYMLNYRQTH